MTGPVHEFLKERLCHDSDQIDSFVRQPGSRVTRPAAARAAAFTRG
jgi:hypothetical protein